MTPFIARCPAPEGEELVCVVAFVATATSVAAVCIRRDRTLLIADFDQLTLSLLNSQMPLGFFDSPVAKEHEAA